MKKRWIGLIAAMAMLIVCGWALADTSGTCGENLTWTLTEDGLLTISGTGEMTDYDYTGGPWRSRPQQVVIEDGVTSIGDYAFANCSNLESITIPDSVTSIGKRTFSFCSSLTSITIEEGNPAYSSVDGVLFDREGIELITCPGGKTGSYTIPSTVTSIGNYAFFECSNLESITIPNGVTGIGECAFAYCYSLESITIPDGVTSIGVYAFDDCSSLTSITIPDSVTSIGEDAFSRCNSLSSIIISEGNTEYSSLDGVLFNQDGTELITCPEGKTGSYTIPSTVTSIGNYAFTRCYGLTSITIPDSVTSIGEGAFTYCSSLTSIMIPDSVTSIGDSAFSSCSSLTSITIPDSVTSIGVGAFGYCSSLTSITIPDSVTSISDFAFSHCSSLTNITIPDSVTSIGFAAFSNCSSLESITSPDRVTSIGYSAFEDCSSLTSITIPDSVTSIEGGTFSGCSSLESITIPDSVTSIEYEAFYNCSSLADVYYSGTELQWNAISIQNNNDPLINCTIHYSLQPSPSIIDSGTCGRNLTWTLTDDGLLTISGTGAMNDYGYSYNAGPWGFGVKQAVIEDGVTSIGEGAFWHCSSLESITIPDSVTSIEQSAFRECSSLESITIPYGVMSIENGTFESCTGLTNIMIPDSVTSIGYSAFGECSSLESITIPNSVTSIDSLAFELCSSLTGITVAEGNPAYSSLDGVLFDRAGTKLINCPEGKTGAYTIPSNVTSIGESAFYNCVKLTSITIPDSVTSIEYDAFRACSSLKSITIPDSVTLIDFGAFYGCSSLTSITVEEGSPAYSSMDGVLFDQDGTELITCPEGKTGAYTIPSTVSDIGENAFINCESLTSITIPNGVTGIVDYTFSGCSGLKSITIPDSVTNIDWCAFEACSSLADVYYSGTEEQWNAITIDAGNEDLKNARIHFNGAGSRNILTLPTTLTVIESGAFASLTNVDEIIIPDAVTSIASDAFEGSSVTLIVTSGSYAETWAIENGMAYRVR